MITTAKLFFDELAAKSKEEAFRLLSDIPSRYETNPFFEEEWLDFKSNPKDEANAKEIWSQALSGFANIGDGLIIWGILAKKRSPEEYDAAYDLRLIEDPKHFVSKLRDWARFLTNPPVVGIEYQWFENSNNEGFVVCYVPESRYKPHRAEFGTRYYYYRASDTFKPVEPNLLRLLFYPQSQPYLVIEASIEHIPEREDLISLLRSFDDGKKYNELINSHTRIKWTIVVRNTGTATGKDIQLVINNPSYQLTNFNLFKGWQIRPSLGTDIVASTSAPLHPGGSSPVAYYYLGDKFIFDTEKSNHIWVVPAFDDITLNFSINADNCQPYKYTITLKPEDFDLKTRKVFRELSPID